METNNPNSYSSSTAKYIRVTDDSGLKVVKKDSIWSYWAPTRDRLPGFSAVNQSGKPTHAALKNEVITDLNNVLLWDKFDIANSVAELPKPLSARAAEIIKNNVNTAEAQNKSKDSGQTTASAQSPKKDINSWAKVPVPLSTQAAPPSLKGRTGKGGSFVRNDTGDHNFKVNAIADYGKFSEAEFKLLFSLAYQMKMGKTDGMAKDWESKDDSERKKFIEDFVVHELVRKKVPDELIPPLEVLKKISIIAFNKELMYYFEKKLGQLPPPIEKPSLAKRGVTKLKNGLTFDTRALPVSLKTSLGMGKLAVKGTGMAVSALHSMLKSKTDDEKFIEQTKAENNAKSNNPSVAKESSVSNESFVSNVTNRVNAVNSSTKNDDKAINKEMFKMIALGLNNIAVVLKNRLSLKPKNKEDISVKAAENLEGKDITLSEKLGESYSSEKTESHEASSTEPSLLKGIFGVLGAKFKKLASLITPLFGLLSALGSALFGLVKTISKTLISALAKVGPLVTNLLKKSGSLIAKGTGSLLPELAEGGAAASVAGAALPLVAGAGSLLGIGYELHGIYKDAQTEKAHNLDENARINDTRELLKKIQDDTVNSPNKPIQVKPKTKPAASSTVLPSNAVPVSKNNANKVGAAEIARSNTEHASRRSETKQTLQEVTKNTNIINGAQQGDARNPVRTQSSSLQRFLETRTVFA